MRTMPNSAMLKIIDDPADAEADASFACEAGVAGLPELRAPMQVSHAAIRTRLNGNRRSAGTGTTRPLIPKEWTLIAPLMGFVLAATAITSRSLPPLLAVFLAIPAIAIVAYARHFVRFEREQATNVTQRFAAMLAVISLPLVLFGLAMGNWAVSRGGATWVIGLAALVATGTVTSLVTSNRPTAMIAAQVALWSGLAMVSASLGSFVMLGLGAGLGIFAAVRQLRQEKLASEQQLAMARAQTRAEEILTDYEQTGQGWFWETDRRGAITYLSPTIAQLLGRSDEAVQSRPLAELFILDAGGQEGERTLAFHLSARSSFQELAVRAATPDEERWWSINGRPLYDEFNNFVGFRGSGSDLTERRRSAEHASRLAHYDSLTGLANRFQMSQTLEKILNAQRLDHRACAVFLLDLDRFKQVNDTMGHPAGDALLRQVAQRLERTVDKFGRVGRLGGDEFQVILPGRLVLDDLAGLARRIIESLSQPYSIDGQRVMIGVSIGIALSPDDGVTSEALIRNADLALYAAKDGGRGRHHFYASDLHDDAEERRQLEQDLRDALTQGGLELHYQPVVQTTTEQITGFEALLRWTHPVRGALSPTKFIPIAEDAGLIAQLGEWALRTACKDLASWPESIRVAVNVSPLQFANPALPAIVTNALATCGVAPSRLELEITESVFLNDNDSTDAMFTALKRIGVRLSLDDFGTGYSSLGYLKKAPFDKIKIDQSFVRGATIAGSRNGAIIAAIVSLAEALGMETTAEGVETLDELDLVRKLGCSHVQGYIYDRPLTTANASAKLASGLNAVARGPRSARAARQTMLRKVLLQHGEERYEGTIRNISTTGAMIEGLYNVPAGTIFRISLTDSQVVTATARWCEDDRLGLEFSHPLPLDESGRIAAVSSPVERPRTNQALLRKTA